MAGLMPMGDLSHELETLFMQIDSGVVAADDRAFGLAQTALDELARMRESVSAGKGVPTARGLIAKIHALGQSAPRRRGRGAQRLLPPPPVPPRRRRSRAPAPAIRRRRCSAAPEPATPAPPRARTAAPKPAPPPPSIAAVPHTETADVPPPPRVEPAGAAGARAGLGALAAAARRRTDTSSCAPPQRSPSPPGSPRDAEGRRPRRPAAAAGRRAAGPRARRASGSAGTGARRRRAAGPAAQQLRRSEHRARAPRAADRFDRLQRGRAVAHGDASQGTAAQARARDRSADPASLRGREGPDAANSIRSSSTAIRRSSSSRARWPKPRTTSAASRACSRT